MWFRKVSSFDTFIFAFVWLLLFFAGRTKLFRDPGTFFHTAAGEYMLNSGGPICHDIFSFTKYGQDWVAHQWLGECLMALIHRVGGLDALLVMTVSAIALLYSWLALKLYRSGINLVLGTLILILALAASSHHLHIRPHIFSIIFLSIVFSSLCDVESGRASLGGLFWLLPVFALWSNIHGGVLGGVITFVIVAAGWTVSYLFRIEAPLRNRKDVAILWLSVILSVAMMIVNPYGMALPDTWISILKSPVIREVIEEHASIVTMLRLGQYHSMWTFAVFLILGTIYYLLVIGALRHRRSTIWTIPFIWLFLSLSSIRHGPLFAVIVLIAIADIYPYVSWVDKLAGKGYTTFKVRKRDKRKSSWPISELIALMGIIVATVLYSACVDTPVNGNNLVTLDKRHWPVEILPDLREIEKQMPEGTPIFNDMMFGGFLIYYTPGLRVFIDDRWELYGDEFMQAYENAGPDEFRQWDRKYGFQIALVNPASALCPYLDEEKSWGVVRRVEAAILYRKKDLPIGRHLP